MANLVVNVAPANIPRYDDYPAAYQSVIKAYFKQEKQTYTNNLNFAAAERGEEHDVKSANRVYKRNDHSGVNSKMSVFARYIATRRINAGKFAAEVYDGFDDAHALPKMIYWTEGHTKVTKYWKHPELNGVYPKGYIEALDAIKQALPKNTKTTGPVFSQYPSDRAAPVAEPHWPKVPDDYQFAPQRWMFTASWLTEHPHLKPHIVPTDMPMSKAEVVETDWYRELCSSHTGRLGSLGSESARKKRKRNEPESDGEHSQTSGSQDHGMASKDPEDAGYSDEDASGETDEETRGARARQTLDEMAKQFERDDDDKDLGMESG